MDKSALAVDAIGGKFVHERTMNEIWDNRTECCLQTKLSLYLPLRLIHIINGLC